MHRGGASEGGRWEFTQGDTGGALRRAATRQGRSGHSSIARITRPPRRTAASATLTARTGGVTSEKATKGATPRALIKQRWRHKSGTQHIPNETQIESRRQIGHIGRRLHVFKVDMGTHRVARVEEVKSINEQSRIRLARVTVQEARDSTRIVLSLIHI